LARKVLIDDDPASELPLRQLRVCAALLEGPLSMSELSRELGVSQSAITQLADRLQDSGMVIRAPDGGDRRVRSLQLTTRARRMLRTRESNRLERVVGVLKGLSDVARSDVLTAFATLREACGDQ
jgi:DNA-binding MarR family transcriptional regulator